MLAFLRSWWWDSWVDPNNLYHIFKPFSVFVSRLPLADYTWNVTDPQVSSAPPYNIRAWGMAGVGQGGEQLVVSWIQDDCFTWANQNSGVKCASHSGLTLTISCSKPSSGIQQWMQRSHLNYSILECTFWLLHYFIYSMGVVM